MRGENRFTPREKINEGEADEMEIEGFVFSPLKCALSSLIVVFTGGLFLILLTWRSDIKLNCLYRKVPLPLAKKILLKDKFHQIFEEDVVQENIYIEGNGFEERKNTWHFVNKKIKYVWDPNQGNYRKLRNLDEHMLASDFHKRNKGLTDNKVQDRVQEFGANFIKISVPPILYLLFHEALNPFYLFQAYTVILWSIQMYWKFAVIIAITSVIATTVVIITVPPIVAATATAIVPTTIASVPTIASVATIASVTTALLVVTTIPVTSVTGAISSISITVTTHS